MFAFPGMLSLTVFLPAIGALAILVFLRGDRVVRGFAFLVGLADLLLSAAVFLSFDRGEGASRFQLVDRLHWISADTFNASYFLGVDGLSAPMVLLTGLLGFCAVIASWSIKERVREYFIWLLLLQTAVMGVFTSLDFLLFFLFWELETVAHVYAHCQLGHRAQDLLGNEVPDFHHPGQRLYAGGHRGRLWQPAGRLF